jgi:preprotein translocase subunit YajC
MIEALSYNFFFFFFFFFLKKKKKKKEEEKRKKTNLHLLMGFEINKYIYIYI